MQEGYKSIKEILKEVGEEENLTLNEMNDLWNHHKKYINKKQEESGVYAIFLPYIGTLSLNVKQYKKEIKHKNRTFYSKFSQKVNSLISDPNYKKYSNAHKKVTGVHRLIKYVTENYKTKKPLEYYIEFHKKCWNLIAKYSNDKLKIKNEF